MSLLRSFGGIHMCVHICTYVYVYVYHVLTCRCTDSNIQIILEGARQRGAGPGLRAHYCSGVHSSHAKMEGNSEPSRCELRPLCLFDPADIDPT